MFQWQGGGGGGCFSDGGGASFLSGGASVLVRGGGVSIKNVRRGATVNSSHRLMYACFCFLLKGE